MKILVALHQVMDLGGIINHTEQLIGGLKDLGHKVHLKEFCYSVQAFDKRKEGNYVIGPSGIPHDQGKGWNFKRNQRIPYRGNVALAGARQQLSEYDLVIWTVPVPSKNKLNLGNHEWPALYDLPNNVRQVAFIHDGNARSGAPHILHIQDRLSGLACVHACALNGADFINVQRALVLNPQENPVRPAPSWEGKSSGFVNMQTFKAWKHVHELIEAIRYMPPKRVGELREVAGRGIEYQYMTSEDKCKDHYFHADGTKFWDAALENGMVYHDYWSTDVVDKWLERSRVLVDPSWSKKYSKIGGHWNRVVVDSMIRGGVPVARKAGMGTELFEAGVNYVEIPEGVSPQQYADIVLETGNMSEKEAAAFREANLEILPQFDRKTVAQQVIDIAHGELAYDSPYKPDPAVQAKYEDLMFNHFGVLV